MQHMDKFLDTSGVAQALSEVAAAKLKVRDESTLLERGNQQLEHASKQKGRQLTATSATKMQAWLRSASIAAGARDAPQYKLPQQGQKQPAHPVLKLLAPALAEVRTRLVRLPVGSDRTWLYVLDEKAAALAGYDALRGRCKELTDAESAAAGAAGQAVSPGPGPVAKHCNASIPLGGSKAACVGLGRSCKGS